MKNKSIRIALILSAALCCALVLSSCGLKGQATDPGEWGYDCVVTYDALGGVINAREVRTTYYMENSYVFKPSGSSNMLVEPARDGYILAGWYTAKSDHTEGSVEDYTFSSADRWDFDTDRLAGDTTLYARWLPRGKVDYINADTGEVIFSKNITTESPIQALSDSVLNLKKPDGTTFAGYYSDPECTKEYDFSSYVHIDPNPSEETLYAALYEQFPQYIEKIEYVEADEDAETDETADTSWLFLNKLGYNVTTDDEAALAEIEAAKDQIVEDAIEAYITNTANRVVYLKFTEGNYVRVNSAKDLKRGTEYGFFDTDAAGNPIDGYSFEADIDLSGVTFTMSESFSGIINGNGYTLSNLTVSAISKKLDTDKEKSIGLTALMDGATINDLTIKDAVINLQVNSGIKVTGGLIALQAKNVTFNNCTFDGLTVTGGKGDDGKARYTLGDLFGSSENVTFNNCTAAGLVPNVREPQKLKLAIFTLPVVEETAADPQVTPAP